MAKYRQSVAVAKILSQKKSTALWRLVYEAMISRFVTICKLYAFFIGSYGNDLRYFRNNENATSSLAQSENARILVRPLFNTEYNANLL